MRRLLPLAVLLGLALPAAASAQSAGDEQYVDPFAPQAQPQAPQAQPGAPQGQSAPQQTAQAAPQGGSADQTASSSASSDSPTAGGTLPRLGARAQPRRGASPQVLGRDLRLARKRR